jgi:hypothetical protein
MSSLAYLKNPKTVRGSVSQGGSATGILPVPATRPRWRVTQEKRARSHVSAADLWNQSALRCATYAGTST